MSLTSSALELLQKRCLIMEDYKEIAKQIYDELKENRVESVISLISDNLRDIRTGKFQLTKTPSLNVIGRKLGKLLLNDEWKYASLKALWEFSNSDIKHLPQGLLSGREIRLIVIGALSVLSKEGYEEAKRFVFHILHTINDWETCDQLALRVIVKLALQNQREIFSVMEEWLKSTNKWVRRLAIATVPPYIRARKGESEVCLKFLANTMEESDKDVIKAIGWALREITKKDPENVFLFLKKWAKTDNQNTVRIIKDGMKKLPSERKNELIAMLSK